MGTRKTYGARTTLSRQFFKKRDLEHCLRNSDDFDGFMQQVSYRLVELTRFTITADKIEEFLNLLIEDNFETRHYRRIAK